MIEVERHGASIWIFLNRPDVLNALHPELIAGVNEALDRAEGDVAARAIVLSGRGRAFCAGADLAYTKEVSTQPGGNVRFVKSVSDLTVRLEDFPLPVLAALNGITVAGGLELALGCDLIIAEPGAKVGDLHANYALFPGGGASVRLARRIGAPAAKRLMFWGETISAADAAELGLVDEVVEANQLVTHVDALVAKLERKSPLVLARLKSAINRSEDVPRQQALQWERETNQLHSHSADRAEGLKAFAEKRAPNYTGR